MSATMNNDYTLPPLPSKLNSKSLDNLETILDSNDKVIKRLTYHLLENKPLSGAEIHELMDASKIAYNQKKYPFLGVYRSDEIPDRLFHPKSRGFVIINLDNKGNGTHWTSFIKEKATKNSASIILYRDSYGLQPPDNMIQRAEYHNITIYHSSIRTQMMDSNRCGFHCIAFYLDNVIPDENDIPLLENYNMMDVYWVDMYKKYGEEKAIKKLESRLIEKVLKMFSILVES